MALIAITAQATGIRWTDGRLLATAPWLGDLLDQLDRPHAIICEPQFYDDLRDVRRHVEDWLRERRHRLVPINEAAREVLQTAGGAKITGRGVTRLFAIATVGTHQLGRATPDGDLNELRAALEVAHLVDLFDERSAVREDALAAVGPYEALDESTRAALGAGSGYRIDVLLAAYRAASVSSSRDVFEQLLGLNAGAHGPLTQTIRAWYVEQNTDEQFVRESVLGWADYRRSLRKIFHRVAEQRRSQFAA
jgi:hypothetical protein